eukprot:238999-Alexandrium_andersonii.AAC.1
MPKASMRSSSCFLPAATFSGSISFSSSASLSTISPASNSRSGSSSSTWFSAPMDGCSTRTRFGVPASI